MKRIVIIDDDIKSLDSLDIVIAVNFPDNKIVYFNHPEEFRKIQIDEISLIILDIMFVGNGEFEGGFDLGLSFYNDFKEMNRSIPIIILTNNEINKIDIEMLKKIQLNNDIIIEKCNVNLYGIIDLIKKILH